MFGGESSIDISSVFSLRYPVSAQAPLAPARGGSGKEGGPADGLLCRCPAVGWLRTYFRSSFREILYRMKKAHGYPRGLSDLSYSMRRNELLPPFRMSRSAVVVQLGCVRRVEVVHPIGLLLSVYIVPQCFQNYNHFCAIFSKFFEKTEKERQNRCVLFLLKIKVQPKKFLEKFLKKCGTFLRF